MQLASAYDGHFHLRRKDSTISRVAWNYTIAALAILGMIIWFERWNMLLWWFQK